MSLLAQTDLVEFATPDIAWSLLAPFVVMAVGGILLITVTSVVPVLRGRGFPAGFTIITAAVSIWFCRSIWNGFADDGSQSIVADALAIDRMTIAAWAIIAMAVFLVSALFDDYLRRENFDGPEWYVLMLMSASGGMLMAAAQDLILIFLGLEILSIAVYVLAGLHLRRLTSQEAAFKYFILGAVASALFLYGIALIYGATGSTNINVIAGARAANDIGLNPVENSSMVLAGMALMMIGFAFKVSAVPFHMWTPDVYQGSPTPVVAFMASAVKVAGFTGLVRVFWDGLGFYASDWRPLISVLAIASLLLGSFMALAQRNVKRMLAYSSITHAGFILVAVHSLAGGSEGGLDSADGVVNSVAGAEAFVFYLLAYALLVIGSFGVLTIIAGRNDEGHDLDDLRGLATSRPVLAGLMAVLLFAQAGVPFTSGFTAKFRVILAAANSGSYVLAGIAMLAAVVAAVLYLRIVVSMFMTDQPAVAHAMTATADDTGVADAEAGDVHEWAVDPDRWARIPRPAMIAVFLAVIATLVLGIFPVGEDMLREAAAEIAFLRQTG